MVPWGISNAFLFIVASLAAVGLLWRTWAHRRDAKEGDNVVRIFLLLGCIAVAVVCVPSLIVFQKFLTKLVMPPALLWLGLALVGVILWRERMRKLSVLVGVMWLLLTLAGTDSVSRRLLAELEREFVGIDPLSVASRYEPFDIVVCLGGATRRSPAGQIEVAAAGDRIVLAARLYNAGHTKLLTATGRAIEEIVGPGRDPADEARILWQGLGVPKDAIIKLGGATTKEEFELIAREAKRRGWTRIGVVTSAWHMRRAKRLANAVGVNVEPLPADFVGVVPTWDRISFVPSGEALAETSRAIKEHLAWIVGR